MGSEVLTPLKQHVRSPKALPIRHIRTVEHWKGAWMHSVLSAVPQHYLVHTDPTLMCNVWITFYRHIHVRSVQLSVLCFRVV